MGSAQWAVGSAQWAVGSRQSELAMHRERANIKDVADLAGVSISTVSHVRRGTKFVSEALRHRVSAAIEQLKYEVNPVASGLKSKATRVLGVVIPNISSIFFPEVLKGIQDYALRVGYRLTFYNTGFDPDLEVDVIRRLVGSWVDGIILDSAAPFGNHNYLDFLAELGGRKKRIPVVSLEREVPGGRVRSVRIDNYEGACMAMRHLLECGCRQIAHIAGPRVSCVADSRRRGYRDELKRASLPYDPQRVVQGDFSPRDGFRAMRKLLDRGLEIDGMLVANDQMAIGAMRAIRDEGLEIPSDIKLVGFDNVFVSSLIQPSLTTIAVPRYQMGFEAARLLVQSIEDPEGAKDILLPIELVVRNSTRSESRREWDLLSW